MTLQVTSHWLSDTGLLLLRCIQLLFFAVTLTLEGTTGMWSFPKPMTITPASAMLAAERIDK